MVPIYITIFQMHVDAAMINKIKLYLKHLTTIVLSCILLLIITKIIATIT